MGATGMAHLHEFTGVGVLLACALLAGCTGDVPTGGSAAAADWVGSASCAECHAQEHADWSGSNHARAMQHATAATVLGDFDDATFTLGDITSRFHRDGSRFLVTTDGADGRLATFEVHYTFGVHPLQQYLVRFEDGRMQALDLAWDARPREQGGQRWIHLHPDDGVRAGDPLHWTGPNLNWNFMCADCHSTGVSKGHDLATNTYKTTWREINVSCESCHGPGSSHVAWARGRKDDARPAAAGDPMGLVHRIPPRGVFAFAPGERIARRTDPHPHAEPESCAQCHARRTPLTDTPEAGRTALDTHLVSLLEDPLYHADGQIRDEVFEYGSYVQSRMHQAGVTCSDCHQPHSGRLIAEGNNLCSRCHDASYYDQPSHHHHAPGTRGAACVDCHMPERHYMVVDPRRDHSIRVPRPDLSVRHGTPNACNQCHKEKDASWAAGHVDGWLREAGKQPPGEHWTGAIDAGRRGTPGATGLLAAAATRVEWPGIVRGTAAAMLASSNGQQALSALQQASRDTDPFGRLGAVRGMEERDEAERIRVLGPLLDDPVRAVRTAAAAALADVSASLPAGQQEHFRRAAGEYVAFQRANGDRDWAHVNLGIFHARQGRVDEAIAACRTALRLDPGSVRGATNLADMLRAQGRDDEGEKVLRDALARAWEKPPLQHALGLLLVRKGEREQGMRLLAEAAAGAPQVSRYAYVHAVALHGEGKVDAAIAYLTEARRRFPDDRDVLQALLAWTRESQGPAAAIPWAEKLLALDPGDAELRAILQQLRSGR